MANADQDLTMEQQATNFHTFRHIERVRNLLNVCVVDLLRRAERHDQTKLASPEVEIFTEFTPKLKDCEYGSDEYRSYLDAMRPALEHHYANNRHHPEHFKPCESAESQRLRRHIETLDPETQGELIASLETYAASMESSVNRMNLLDIVELIVDWKAASERQFNGNIRKSIEQNESKRQVLRWMYWAKAPVIYLIQA